MNFLRFLFCGIFFLLVFCFQVKTQDLQVKNVHFVDKQNVIAVYYDLIGNYENKFQISLSLSNDFGKNFEINPISLKGEVGKNIKPGKNKEIFWDIKKDFPNGLSGDGFVFAVDAQLQKGRRKWPYYLLGTGALIGGAVYYLSQGDESENGSISIAVPRDF